MRDAIRRYVDTLQSLVEVPRERAEGVARRLADGGLIRRGQIREVASDIVERSRANRRRVTQLIGRELRRQVGSLGLATTDDIERLRQRVQALEVSGRRARATAATAPKPSGRAGRPVARTRKSVTRTRTPVARKPVARKRRPAAGARSRKPGSRR